MITMQAIQAILLLCLLLLITHPPWHVARKIILGFPGDYSAFQGIWKGGRYAVTTGAKGKTYTTGWNNAVIITTPLARERTGAARQEYKAPTFA